MPDFSFSTLGRYPNNIKLVHPCDIRSGEEAVLVYRETHFYIYHIIGSGDSKNIYYKSHAMWLLTEEYIKLIPYVGYGRLNPDPRAMRIIFDGNTPMDKLLEIADTIIIEDVTNR